MPGQVVERVSVAANARTDVMTGTPHEFPDAQGNVVTVAAVTEGAAGSLTCTVTVGTRSILEAGHVNGPVTAGFGPVLPDNVIARGVALPGERIRVFLQNTTGGAIVGTALVDLS